MNSTAQFHRSFFSAAPTSGPARAGNQRSSASFAGALAATAQKHASGEPLASPPLSVREVIVEQPRKSGLLSRAWSWFTRNRAFGAEKQMRILETLSLGEKRFVALLNVEGRKFLVGGGASGVSLITPLDPAPGSDATASISRSAERAQ